MKQLITALSQGLVLGVILVIILEITTRGYEAYTAVKQCEKSLPRNQTCIIIAKPLLKQD